MRVFDVDLYEHFELDKPENGRGILTCYELAETAEISLSRKNPPFWLSRAAGTKKPNGTFLIRVSNGMKNGKQDLVSTIYKPPVGSTSAMARKAAEKYAVLFEELVHSGGYEKKQAVSREIRARRRMTIEQFVQDYYYPSIQKHLSPTTCRTYHPNASPSKIIAE